MLLLIELKDESSPLGGVVVEHWVAVPFVRVMTFPVALVMLTCIAIAVGEALVVGLPTYSRPGGLPDVHSRERSRKLRRSSSGLL